MASAFCELHRLLEERHRHRPLTLTFRVGLAGERTIRQVFPASTSMTWVLFSLDVGPYHARLIFNGQQLGLGGTLSDHNIQHESVIDVVLMPAPGTPPVNISTTRC